MFTVRRYEPSDAAAWDALVMRSRNGNLLHRRGYMDYHAHRFTDASLVIERDGDIVAVFPANRQQDTIASHGGLTYAGLISGQALRAEATLAIFGSIRDFYRETDVTALHYKAVPHVFHAYPAEEDLYALHRFGARLVRRDLSSVIPLRQAHALTQGRKAAGNKARNAGVVRQEGNDPAEFHALLVDVLQRHEVTPTHSLPELRLLHARFLPAPVERRRGDIDQSRATASAKLAEALSIEEAVAWLKPGERVAVLLDRSLLDWLATLPVAAGEATSGAETAR